MSKPWLLLSTVIPPMKQLRC